jgi:hypothetical protein
MPINFAIKLVATVALEAASIGLQAMRRTQGPRLSETQVTTADYGTPLPRFKGERRFAGQIIWSKDLEIVDQTHKIKGGGKQTTQSALWTAGVAFADVRGMGPIDKVLKIWLDETLAYDATGSGPTSFASSLGFDLNSVMRIYKGGEDQEADPAYVEYCEDRYGPNSAPAFRGTAMLVFDRMPTDNFGNRPPQISVLAVSSADSTHPVEFLETAHPIISPRYSPDGTQLYCVQGTGFEVIDLPTRTSIIQTFASPTASTNNGAVGPDGYYRVGSGSFNQYPLDGGAAIFSGSSTDQHGSSYNGCYYAGGLIWCTPTNGTTHRTAYFDGAGITGVDTDFCPSHYFEDADGNALAIGPNPSGTGFYIADAASGTATLVDNGSSTSAAYAMDNGQGSYVVRQSDTLFLVDKATLTITSSAAVTSVGSLTDSWANVRPGAASIWNGAFEYSTTDLSLLRTVTRTDWDAGSVDGGASETSQLLFEPTNGALLAFTTAIPQAGIIFRYLDRFANGGTTLGEIVSQMCDDAGLIDRDTSLLTQFIAGYSWTRGDVKSQMEPALDIHDVDARPHDFEIEFLPRGTAPSGTILTGEFAKNGSEPRYKITEKQDTDLPKLLRVNFADTEFDQEENNVLSPLQADVVDSQRDDVTDLTTYAASPAEAQKLADRYMRRQWNSKDGVENSLTARELAKEPGDTTTLDLNGTEWNVRLKDQTFAAGRIDCTWVRDEPAFALLNDNTTGPSMGGRDPEVIVFPAAVRGFVLDVPLREDSDDDLRPLLYSGAGAYAQLAFPGATIWEQTGAGDSAAYDQLVSTVRSGATWGLCSGTLADANPNLWDRGNTLSVTLQGGSLTSVSEADIDAEPALNLILVGKPTAWEYLNFTTATLEVDGSYTLSGFKRGRRGTEWACGGHGSSEAFIFASSLEADEFGSDDVGDNLNFKAQGLGRSLDAAPVIDVEPFTGATLKPYAPARLNWTTDGTDMFGEIIRRTRIGGAWTDSGIVPLSENTEAYEIDIYHGSTFKRTIAVTGTNLFTYSAAEIAADGNSVGVAPPSNVFQLSDAVGRGFALAA